MKISTKRKNESMLLMQRNLFFFLSIFLLLTTLASTSLALRNKTMTFFKAPEIKLDLQASRSQAEFLAHLILNRSSNDHPSKNASLMPWVAPSYSFKLRENLKKQEQEAINSRIDFEWVLSESIGEQLNPSNVRVYLKGNLSAYLPIQDGKKQLVQEEFSTFVMDLKHNSGKLLLNKFTKESRT